MVTAMSLVINLVSCLKNEVAADNMRLVPGRVLRVCVIDDAE